MASTGGNAGKKVPQSKMEVRAGTSVSEAIALWKKKIVIARVTTVLAGIFFGLVAWRTWKPRGGFGQFVVVALAVLLLVDSVRLSWQERRDPALGTYDRGMLKFYWISGRSAEVPVAKVRRVKAHENAYWQVRRIYPKWFELEVMGEPSKVIIPAFNLKPQARDVLERMSRQGATAR